MVRSTTLCVLALLGLASVATAYCHTADHQSGYTTSGCGCESGVAKKSWTVFGDQRRRRRGHPTHYTTGYWCHKCSGSGTDGSCSCPTCYSGPQVASTYASFGDQRRRRRGHPRYTTYTNRYGCGGYGSRNAKNGGWSGWGNWGAWGGWGNWGNWSACNASGDRWRWRTKYRASYRGCTGATCGGRNSHHTSYCPGGTTSRGQPTSETSHSNIKKNGWWSGYGNWGAWGNWGNWGNWGACNSTGDRWRYRYRYRASYRSCGGASCGGANTVNTAYCPGSTGRSMIGHTTSWSNIRVNCGQSGWSAWNTCTKSCGSGSQTRTRTITRHPSCGGTACASATDTRACNNHACPVDCVPGSFSGWSTCTKSCANGFHSRTRSNTAPKHGGKACPHTAETRVCNHGPCAVHCVTSPFSAWSTCSKSCEGGTQSRARRIITFNIFGGYVCPYLKETRSCNSFVCPIDGGWSAFNKCDQFCGSGSQSRTCNNPAPHHGGAFCSGSATGACNTAVCPKAPTCFVLPNGETRVVFTRKMSPSFKCTHTANKCTCTLNGHPTHHEGGCKQMDHIHSGKHWLSSPSKTISFAGDCTGLGARHALGGYGDHPVAVKPYTYSN